MYFNIFFGIVALALASMYWGWILGALVILALVYAVVRSARGLVVGVFMTGVSLVHMVYKTARSINYGGKVPETGDMVKPLRTSIEKKRLNDQLKHTMFVRQQKLADLKRAELRAQQGEDVSHLIRNHQRVVEEYSERAEKLQMQLNVI